MSILYCPEPIQSGPGTKFHYRAVGTSLVSMKEFYYANKDQGVKLYLPPISGTLKSRQVPRLTIPTDQRHLVEDDPIIPETYLKVLYLMRKRDFMDQFSRDPFDKEAIKKVDSEIRARIVDLIFAEDWIGSPESSILDYVNSQIEKIDLGRYKNLKPGKPIPKDLLERRRKYTKVVARELEQEKRFRRQIDSEVQAGHLEETPFQRALRERREQGLEQW